MTDSSDGTSSNSGGSESHPEFGSTHDYDATASASLSEQPIAPEPGAIGAPGTGPGSPRSWSLWSRSAPEGRTGSPCRPSSADGVSPEGAPGKFSTGLSTAVENHTGVIRWSTRIHRSPQPKTA